MNARPRTAPRQTGSKLESTAAIALAIALLTCCSCDSQPVPRTESAASNPRPIAEPSVVRPLALERMMLSLSQTPSSMTAMAFRRTTAPPWNEGNTWEFRPIIPASPGRQEEHADWQVVNIVAENLGEITRRLGIDELEVHVLHRRQPTEYQETGRPARTILTDAGYALVTDRRIPKDWFVWEPRCDRETGRRLKAEYPEAFRATK